MSSDQPRETNGQFGATAHAESGVALADPNTAPHVLAAIAEAKRTGTPVVISGIPGNDFDADEDRTGSMCGDYSLGAEPSNRITWATGNDTEPFVSVTETYYVTGRLDGAEGDLDYADWDDHTRAVRREADRIGGTPDALPRVRYGVDSMTEWIAHRDVADLGGSEVRSDYAYGDGSALSYSSLESAEAEARRLARGMAADDYSPENWK